MNLMILPINQETRKLEGNWVKNIPDESARNYGALDIENEECSSDHDICNKVEMKKNYDEEKSEDLTAKTNELRTGYMTASEIDNVKSFEVNSKLSADIEKLRNDTEEVEMKAIDKNAKYEEGLEEYGKHKGVRHYCDLCTYQAKSEKRLETHKHRAHDANYECGECGNKCASRTGLIQHTKAKHEELRRECETCAEVFRERFTLGKHEQWKFNCARTSKMCGNQSKLSGDLRTHMDKYRDARSVKFSQTGEDCSQEFKSTRHFELYKSHRTTCKIEKTGAQM